MQHISILFSSGLVSGHFGCLTMQNCRHQQEHKLKSDDFSILIDVFANQNRQLTLWVFFMNTEIFVGGLLDMKYLKHVKTVEFSHLSINDFVLLSFWSSTFF